MNVQKRNASPRYKHGAVTSYLLVSAWTCASERLTITLVEMEPGSTQEPHSHLPEQTYYILEGSGIMTVESERQPVQQGDCIHFPSQAVHGLANTGGSVLKYLSAASPSFTPEQCEKLWPLPSLEDESK